MVLVHQDAVLRRMIMRKAVPRLWKEERRNHCYGHDEGVKTPSRSELHHRKVIGRGGHDPIAYGGIGALRSRVAWRSLVLSVEMPSQGTICVATYCDSLDPVEPDPRANLAI